ncbi:MAG TPA: hypothetical protein VE244_03815 [Nitrososphaeraceae archaeon]|nr:hypothetical protein [Nitrososphaeraceae archaeon]
MVTCILDFKKQEQKLLSSSCYFHSHIFPPELPFSSTSYSNTPTTLLRKPSLPVVVDEDVLQNTEPISLLFRPE